jgi:hypothetical protein
MKARSLLTPRTRQSAVFHVRVRRARSLQVRCVVGAAKGNFPAARRSAAELECVDCGVARARARALHRDGRATPWRRRTLRSSRHKLAYEAAVGHDQHRGGRLARLWEVLGGHPAWQRATAQALRHVRSARAAAAGAHSCRNCAARPRTSSHASPPSGRNLRGGSGAAAAAAATSVSGAPSNTPAPRSRSSGSSRGGGCGWSAAAATICSVSTARPRSEQKTASKRVGARRTPCCARRVRSSGSASARRRTHQRRRLRPPRGRQRAVRVALRAARHVVVRLAVAAQQHAQHHSASIGVTSARRPCC